MFIVQATGYISAQERWSIKKSLQLFGLEVNFAEMFQASKLYQHLLQSNKY
jgi:hypothetical protein